MKLLPLHILLGITLLFAVPSQAQVGAMKWQFRSRAEVVPALQKTRGKLRPTYEVLICAARLGYINTALGFYEKIVLGNEFSASVQDSAAFAYAHDLADNFIYWPWKKDTYYRDYKGSNEATTILFRDRALEYGANSPEVLVMRAYRGRFYFKENRKKSFELALKAVTLAPDWADAQYWLGNTCQFYGLAFQDENTSAANAMAARLGKLGMRSFDKAEKLNPSIRPYLYLERIELSRLIADKKAAQMIPIYADLYLRAFPEYAVDQQKRKGRSEQDIRAMYAKISADIMAKATS